MDAVIDFHSHILPAIDDGSSTVEESIEMLKMEAEQGIEHVIATPHFYASRDHLERFLERRRESEQLLRDEMKKHNGLPKLNVGSEVHYFNGISNSKDISGLAISSTDYILIEMSHPPWSKEMFSELEQIYIKQGLTPIIAHVDRYISRFKTYNIPQKLAEMPVLVQANAEFFINKRTSSMAMRMLRDGEIHLIGSDCHNLDSRKPNLGDAVKLIKKRLGESAIAEIAKHGQNVLSKEKTCIIHTQV